MSVNQGNLLDSNINQTNPAIVEIANNETYQFTYQQIKETADAVANGLLHYGVCPGEKIAIVASNSAKFIATYLGILKFGGTAVLVNAKFSLPQILHVVKNSHTTLAFVDQPLELGVPTVDFTTTFENFCVKQMFDSYQPDPEDVALILYTSGSSGTPKGVAITHQSRFDRIRSKNPSSDRVSIVATPCYHNNGLFLSESTLAAGGTLVMLGKFDSKTYLQALHDHKVTHLNALPTMMNMLLLEDDLLRSLNLSSVQHINMSSEPVNETLYLKVLNAFPDARINIGYGSTEGGPGIFGPHPSLPTPPLSVGYPLPEISYRIVKGVLQIKSPYMMKQYINGSDVFTNDGYYITNDLFEVDQQGFYYYQGRSDNVFKSGGNKISPGDIEKVIGNFSGVKQVSVVGLEDPIKGTKPYAFVCVDRDSNISEQELIKYCFEHLAPYQIPRRIWTIETMPTNAVGKTDQTRLKDLAQQYLQDSQ